MQTATVRCDCFEKNKVRTPPPFPEKIYIDEEGCPSINADPWEISRDGEYSGPGWEQVYAFDEWSYDACEHEHFLLMLDDIPQAFLVQSSLAKMSDEHNRKYSVVWSIASHENNIIKVDSLPTLRDEVEHLSACSMDVLDQAQRSRLSYFMQQVRDLVQTALSVNKPIVLRG